MKMRVIKRGGTWILLASLLIVLLAVTGCGSAADTKASTSDTSAQSSSIKVIDAQGNSKTIDLTSLPQSKGTGMFKKSTGTVVGPAELSGPKLSEVFKAAGIELKAEDALEFVATDGYKMTLDYNQATGNVMTYKENGEAAEVRQLDVLVALKSSTEEVGEGLPRLVYVGEDSPLSDGHLWVKLIDTIVVKAGVADWTIELSGYTQFTMDRATYESGATCPDTPHKIPIIELANAKGGKDTYEGSGLWLMVAVVDGGEKVNGHYTVNRDIVRSDYTVRLTNKDGETMDLKSRDVSYNDQLVLAYKKNNSILSESEGPLVLVNIENADKPTFFGQVTKIELLNLPKQ